jgi:DNA (cytosine-5)-methyltransferase 1
MAFGGNNQAGPIDVATARNACASASGRMDFESETFLVQPVAHSLRAEGFDASEDGTGRGTPLVPVHAFDARQSDVVQYGDMTGPLDTDGHSVAVAFDTTQITSAANYSNPKSGDPCHPLAAGAHAPAVATSMAVRRLTPIECERLQGFPDDYTAIPWRGKPASECPDGPRYKALGNSMAVPCMRWIGERIAAVELIKGRT